MTDISCIFYSSSVTGHLKDNGNHTFICGVGQASGFFFGVVGVVGRVLHNVMIGISQVTLHSCDYWLLYHGV